MPRSRVGVVSYRRGRRALGHGCVRRTKAAELVQNDYINLFGGRVALSDGPSTDRSVFDRVAHTAQPTALGVANADGVVAEPCIVRIASDTSEPMKICMPIDVSLKSTVGRLHNFARVDAFRHLTESCAYTSTPYPIHQPNGGAYGTHGHPQDEGGYIEVVACSCGGAHDGCTCSGGRDAADDEPDRRTKRWRHACPQHDVCNTTKLPTRDTRAHLDDGLRGHLLGVASRVDLSRMRLITFFFTALKRALYDPRSPSEISPPGATLEEERRVGDTALFDVADVMVRSLRMHDDEMSLFVLYVDDAARHYDVRNTYGDMRLLLALAVIAHKVCHDEPLSTSAMAEICGLSPSRLLAAEFDIWTAMWDRGVVLGQRTDAMLAVINLASVAVKSPALDHMFLPCDGTDCPPV